MPEAEMKEASVKFEARVLETFQCPKSGIEKVGGQFSPALEPGESAGQDSQTNKNYG
jgi:hypothetical protein